MQQVNLYVPELRPSKEWLTARSLSLIVLCFCLLLLVSVAINRIELSRYEKKVVHLEQQREASYEQVENIKAHAPVNVVTVLDKEIISLRQRIRQRVAALDLISQQNLGNRKGYSNRLNDLARTVSQDLSVLRFNFSQGTRMVELLGESKESERVAEMIANLKKRPSFNDTTFGALTISANSANNWVKYSFGFEPVFNSESFLNEIKR